MSSTSDALNRELRERLRFESLLTELSSRFVNLEPAAVDQEIGDALEQICECLGLDLAALWQWADREHSRLVLTHLYRILEEPPVPDSMDAREYFPWCLDQSLAGRVTVFSTIDETPPEASKDRESWRYYGVKSGLVIPLAVGNEHIEGVLGFHTVQQERSIPDEIVHRLQLVSQIFANSLARRHADEALRQSEERVQLAVEAAETGMWEFDVARGVFWASDRARELFEFEPETEIPVDRFLDVVHVDDRNRVEAAVTGAVNDGEPINLEYRIGLQNGQRRWIRSLGQRDLTATEERPRLLGISMDVTEIKNAEQHQANLFRFETLLADLSTRFVNVPTEDVDSVIENAQHRVCEFLDIELSALWQDSPDQPGTQVLTHLYHPRGVPPIPDQIDAREHFPWSLEQMLAGNIVALESIDHAPPEAAHSKESWQRLGVKSTLILPLAVGGGPPVGSLSFNTLTSERPWPDEIVQRLKLISQVFANALVRKNADTELRRTLDEVERLKGQLEVENTYLRQAHRPEIGHGRIVGESPAIREVLTLVEQVAPTQTTTLIEGETGTGKELIAQRIHELSRRCDRPMIKVNCAALPSTLVESELFGREKGAYTGAVSRGAGRFEVADGSTIFLDEVAELPTELQSKMLRVLEEGQFERVGSSRTLKTDVRVIAATNRDLQAEVEAGRFRRDLYFRLAVFPILVPPLRERRHDIPLLVWSMVEELGQAMNKSVESIRLRDMESLQRYDWPGNVRELRNLVERALILSTGPQLRITPPGGAPHAEQRILPLDEAQRQQIVKAVEAAGGRVGGAGGAAELLGVKPTTLRSKMKRLGLVPAQLKKSGQAELS